MQGSGDIERGENQKRATLYMQHCQCQQEPTCSISSHKASTEVYHVSSVRTSTFMQFSCDRSFSNCPDAIDFCLPWCDTTSSYTPQKGIFSDVEKYRPGMTTVERQDAAHRSTGMGYETGHSLATWRPHS